MTDEKKAELFYQTIKTKWENELSFKTSLDTKAIAINSISLIVITAQFYNVGLILDSPEKISFFLSILIILGFLFPSFSFLFSFSVYRIIEYKVGAEINDYRTDFLNKDINYGNWVMKIVDNYEEDVGINKRSNETKARNINFASFLMLLSIVLYFINLKIAIV